MKRKKKKKIFRRILLCALIAVAVVVGVLSYLQFRSMAGTEEKTVPFRFDQYSDNEFHLLDKGMLVVSDLSYSVFNDRGDKLAERIHNYDAPLCEVSGDYAILWSQVGSTATVVSAEGDAFSLNIGGNISGADINSAGWAVCIGEENGSKGLVTAFDPDGEQLFKLHMGASYPVDADLLQENTKAVVLSLRSGGSYVSLYDFDAEEAVAEWSDSDDLFFEIETLSNGNLLVLSSGKAVCLDSRCRLLGEYSFEGSYLRDYVTQGDGNVALLLGRYRSGGSTRLVTLNTQGTELAARELSDEVEGISAAGKYLAVRCSNQTVIYSSVLQEITRLESAAEILDVLMRSDGSAIIVSGGIAAVYQP